MILDTDRLSSDGEYRAEIRHRCLTDHFFLAEMIGFDKFNRRIHEPAVKLYFPKNHNLSIEEQHPKKYRMHLDPRGTFKTTLGRVDSLQWVLAFPEKVTILNESATQPLAAAISKGIALFLWRAKGRAPTPLQLVFPELTFDGKEPEGTWNTPTRKLGDLDSTLAFTSPKSSQSGWHPYVINPDDMVDTVNSGIDAADEVRQSVINTYNTNKNTLRHGGYINIRGTRYHPFDLYGEVLEKMDPEEWEVLIRCSLTVKNGRRLLPGEFPEEDEVDLHFPELPGMNYRSLRQRFFEDYESFMCFRAGCKVLMADWTEKPIEQIKVDDEVIGFERTGRHEIKFRKAKVQKLFLRRAEVAEVKTECGRITYPTFDHRFLRPPNGGELRYVRLKPGSKMVSVYTPQPPPPISEQRDLDWLGGILDGEGSISPAGIAIYQKKSTNPEVHAAIVETLKRLNINFASGLTHTTDRFALAGGRSLLIRLLQHAQTAKLQRIQETLWRTKQIAECSGRRGGGSYLTVASMKSVGEQVVYDIQTSTSNFVCDGFAVHNCQQQNDPQGGNVATFDEDLFRSMQIPVENIPALGDTYICWRMPYAGKKYMAKTAEGCAARIWEGKVYIVDAWAGIYTPSRLAEKIVRECRRHQTGNVIMEDLPGVQYIEGNIRNEALRRNTSVRIQWLEFEEDDNLRNERMRNLEPQARAGRLLISTATGRAAELRRQVLNFGLVLENGILDCISRLASKVPISMMRTDIDEEETERQMRRKADIANHFAFNQGGMQELEDRKRREAEAAAAAWQNINTGGLSDILGGLDG
jgi:hypothetical protein